MKELSLNILDVAKNSVKAGATRIVIRIDEAEGWRCEAGDWQEENGVRYCFCTYRKR